jgi:hypothetical protein
MKIMANLNISAAINAADKAQIEASITQIKTLLPFLINMDPQARKRLRKMATKRAGYVAEVYNAVIANPSVVPASFDVTEYTKDKVLYDDLVYIRDLIITLSEAIEDTLLTLGGELMHESDSAYNYMQRAAKDNSPLSETVKKIGTAFTGQGKKKSATTFTLPLGGKVTVKNVVPGTRLVNTGTTVIRFKAGADLSGKIKSVFIPVAPGDSEIIPDGYTSIEVVNDSGTTEGSFSVKVK